MNKFRVVLFLAVLVLAATTGCATTVQKTVTVSSATTAAAPAAALSDLERLNAISDRILQAAEEGADHAVSLTYSFGHHNLAVKLPRGWHYVASKAVIEREGGDLGARALVVADTNGHQVTMVFQEALGDGHPATAQCSKGVVPDGADYCLVRGGANSAMALKAVPSPVPSIAIMAMTTTIGSGNSELLKEISVYKI